MKVQQDSFEERSESPDLPEPLYEEVGDFGLQVLKSLETSFLSSSATETQEVTDHSQLRLVPMETKEVVHVMVSDQVQTSCESLAPGDQNGGNDGGAHSRQLPALRRRRQQLQGVCTPSQELLLQELSSAFIKKPEEEEQEVEPEREDQEKLYDV